MNILFYYQSISLGGQQIALLNLCSQLSKMGHHPIWAYWYGRDLANQISQYAILEKIDVIHFKKQRARARVLQRFQYLVQALLIFFQLLHISSKHNIDLIVSSDSGASILCGLVSKLVKAKHFRIIGCDLEQVEAFWLRNYRRFMIDKTVDYYFGWPKVYTQLSQRCVSKSKFVQFPSNAVNTDEFYPLGRIEREYIKKELGFDNYSIVIGWSGRLAPNMQVRNTIELVKELHCQCLEKVKLLIVGGGRFNPYTQKEDLSYVYFLKELITEYGLSDHTVFMGWLHHQEMNRMMNAMDIVPLLEEDPQGGSILREAMACGRVALSVDGISGTQRSFMNTDCAILVEPVGFLNNAVTAIRAIMEQPKMIEKLGARARQYCIENMSFRKQAEMLVQYIGRTR